MDNIFLNQEHFEQIFQSHLKTETYPKSIETLFSGRFLNKVDYKPYYQRNYVWDKDKASYFIESILLGTEIPPLIFFNNGKNIEVIDGRQRFETIKRFKESQFNLTKKGLSVLKQLAKSNFDSLGNNEETSEIIDIFLDAKIRIIEFKIVNEPRLNSFLEDKVKKEIFRRYNSGITPLKRFDIDNAVYVDDFVSNSFKNLLKADESFKRTMSEIFFFNESKKNKDPKIGKILHFIRRNIVLYKFPITYYARGTNRVDILEKLYAKTIQEYGNDDIIFNNFIAKIKILKNIKERFLDFKFNRLVYECLLWGLSILEEEKFDVNQILDEKRLSILSKKISADINSFSENESHYYGNIMKRYACMADILGECFSFNFSIYIDVNSEAARDLKKLREIEVTDTITKLNELESLRITKPDPSRNSIDDIVRRMDRRKFLVRPAYQRDEVINLSKASAIIESILLDINLPPIFIFKREDGISEVIDGQQRLLTILGFLGKEYINEDGKRQICKNSRFSLKGLNILKDLNKKNFEKLSQQLKDKVWDFGLLIVEIEERLNPKFSPVDLFVRLNDKPYPIKENSFEMWNSWVDRGIISNIRDNIQKHKTWFYIKPERSSDGSRMENEEIYASLAYLEYRSFQKKDIWKYLYMYKQKHKINVRISSMKEITKILEISSQNESDKNAFISSIKNIEKFIAKLKIILLNKDIPEEKERYNFFLEELNLLFKAERELKVLRRTKQDFYILWYLISPLPKTMVEYHRLQIRKEIKQIFVNSRKIGTESGDVSQSEFKLMLNEFAKKFKPDKRQLKLSESEKYRLIKQQNNIDPISGAPMFEGDEVEVDHKKPIVIGGKDSINNLQISHKNSNRRKGSTYET